MAGVPDPHVPCDASLDHTDPSRWQSLIDEADPAAMQVVIANAMSRELRGRCTPEDIWQETLAHAWRDRARHRSHGSAVFRAWLFEIARNRIREAARSLAAEKRGAGRHTKRFSELPMHSASTASAYLPCDSETPSRIVARGEKREALQRALSELPPEIAEVVRLHLLDELTMEDVSARLGIGLSAAWRRFRKGFEMLARILPGSIVDGSSSPS